MVTLAIFNKSMSPAAAVYVAETKSWKLVKNFSEGLESAYVSSTKLEVGSSIPNLDIAPSELEQLLASIQTGVNLICNHIVSTNPEVKAMEVAVPGAVKQMFQGCRSSWPYKGTDTQTICVTHGGSDFIWNENTSHWEFKEGGSFQDGSFNTINGDKHFHLTADELALMVSAYLDTFPLNSAGDFGTVYTFACV